MKKRCELTILMPCLDEAETLKECIRKARRFLQRSGINGEIIVADNGSKDGSQTLAVTNGARVIDVPERGYGNALIAGIGAAQGLYVIMGDSDDSYDFSDLDLFVEKLRAGYDLVMGNRFRGGIRPGAMPLLHRYLGNPVLSMLGRLFFRSPCGDFQCGLRGFRRDAILALNLYAPGMEFASEMIVKATIAKLRITEVPTILSPDGRLRSPHLRSWHDGWRYLRILLLFSPGWLFLYPGLGMFAIGFLGMGWLLPGPRIVGNITFDYHTLFYCSLAMTTGFQSVLFWMCAKLYDMQEGFIPPTPWLSSVRSIVGLEYALILGCVLMVSGFALSVYALSSWGWNSLGLWTQPRQCASSFRREL